MEAEFAEFFKVKHAISVNSWTSGLIAAVGALGLDPGDEVIVSTWTMSASATAILHWNLIPVFADIDPNTYCIDPDSVRSLISSRTKAIMAVDIFGQSSDTEALLKLCQEFNLKLISDSAQSPNAFREEKLVGTSSHIGGISLNYHKHIHCGEGGVIFTNDDQLALRMKLIRNHGEVVLRDMPNSELPESTVNIIGYNFRLGEIEAAIAREQLLKLEILTKRREQIAQKLNDGLKDLKGLITPFTEETNTHVYYMYPLRLNIEELGVDRKVICNSLEEAGLFGVERGYENLHLLPIYQKRDAYGKSGIPWSLNPSFDISNYSKGSCPIAEEFNDISLFLLPLCAYKLDDEDVEDIIKIFHHIWKVYGWKST
jgi:dTDP-4-amino-4,6-dideoxygalactose transaminase